MLLLLTVKPSTNKVDDLVSRVLCVTEKPRERWHKFVRGPGSVRIPAASVDKSDCVADKTVGEGERDWNFWPRVTHSQFDSWWVAKLSSYVSSW